MNIFTLESHKVLLTVNINCCGLMLAFIREANTAVVRQNDRKELLEAGEASLRSSILNMLTTDWVFYCHPYSASEKPHVENNHENQRKIIEKCLSFDGLTQKDVDLVVCHVNSMVRKAYGDKTAINRFIEMFGVNAAKRLNLRKIPADDACLRPELVGLGKKS